LQLQCVYLISSSQKLNFIENRYSSVSEFGKHHQFQNVLHSQNQIHKGKKSYQNVFRNGKRLNNKAALQLLQCNQQLLSELASGADPNFLKIG